MKRLLCLLPALFFLTSAASALAPRDSIIVQFGNKSKIIIYTQNKDDFRKLQNYDLNRLLNDLGVKVDSISPTETRVVVAETDGKVYLKDSVRRSGSGDRESDYVRIGIRGIHVKDGDDEVHIDWSGIHVKSSDGEEVNIGRADTTRYEERRRNRWWAGANKGFYLSLGLNNVVQGEPIVGLPASQEFTLRPLGSRYFAFGWLQNARLVRGRDAALNLNLGLEFSWYNFMFEGNRIAVKDVPTAGRFGFQESTESLRKSKLTVAYINMPLMLTTSFRRGFFSYLSAGGHVGYRLDAYTKIKRGSGGKDHAHGNFYLENFRYGLRAELGIRNFPDLFVNYDLNPLFAENKGPDLRAVSFGIKF
jgi:hypothetical protein